MLLANVYRLPARTGHSGLQIPCVLISGALKMNVWGRWRGESHLGVALKAQVGLTVNESTQVDCNERAARLARLGGGARHNRASLLTANGPCGAECSHVAARRNVKQEMLDGCSMCGSDPLYRACWFRYAGADHGCGAGATSHALRRATRWTPIRAIPGRVDAFELFHWTAGRFRGGTSCAQWLTGPSVGALTFRAKLIVWTSPHRH